jgi:hypothetical protein
MESIKIKYTLLSLMLLASLMPIISFNEAQFEQEMNRKEPENKSSFNKRDDDSDCATIKVGKLKADRVLARCVGAKTIDTECIDADHVRAYDVSADLAYLAALCTQTICANQFVSNSVDAQSVATNNLSVAGNSCLSNLSILGAVCASSLNASDACITNTLRVANLLNCGLYRATVTLSTNITYTLGNYIDFDVVLDDPNGDVVTSPNFAYIAPVSGYYVATLELDQQNLMPFNGSPILGTPVANPQFFVNGVLAHQSYFPFLTFLNTQKLLATRLVHLHAGDVAQVVLQDIALNQTSGVMDIAGTTDLLGNGTDINTSYLRITLLNVDCATPLCTPCTPTPCQPSTPLTCGPCTSLPGCEPCNPCVPCTPCQCS